MRIYIIEKPETNTPEEGLTGNYHNGGGCVIIAHDDEDAMRLVAEYNEGTMYSDERIFVGLEDLGDSYELNGGPAAGLVKVFPNAGCC
jgi:hypothetical protein